MKRHIISILAVTVLAAAMPALAEPPPRHHRPDHRPGHAWGSRPDIRHFDHRHFDVWRGGKWHHGRHDGRLGWWWIAAGTWYFYPQPVYPYPDPYVPPVVVVPQATAPAPQPAAPVMQQQAQKWYYCEASKGYYPYVPSCPAGWKEVPAIPPGAPAN